jgi:hypothetical protein
LELTTETPKKLSLMELIDRYVPRHTREEVVQMSFVFEDRIKDLLLILHSYYERNAALQKAYVALEEETFKREAIKVPIGRITSDTAIDPYRMEDIYRVMWRPDPMMMAIALPRVPLHPEEYPRMFEGVMRQFEEQLVQALTKQLKAEYGNLYAAAHRKR